MLALVAAAMLLQADATMAGTLEAGAGGDASDGNELSKTSALMAAVIDASNRAWQVFHHWVVENYERAPALMLGLSALLAVPPLTLAGLLVRRTRTSRETTRLLSRPRGRTMGRRRTAMARTEVSAWPTEAWVEVVGLPGERFVIGHSLVRIGREEDNDIRFSASTVHRYHAVIRRTTEGDVVITDLSGDEGNGVLVNGERVTEARLTKGDHINVGEVRLCFQARPV